MSNESAKFFKLLFVSRLDKQPFGGEEVQLLKPYLEHDELTDDITKLVFFKGYQHLVLEPKFREMLLESEYFGETYLMSEVSFVVKGANIARRATEAVD